MRCRCAKPISTARTTSPADGDLGVAHGILPAGSESSCRARQCGGRLWLACVLLVAGASPCADELPENVVKPSAVAGTWYTDDAVELGATLDRLLAQAPAAPATQRDTIRALISPHAAYRYSGGVAAAGYRQLAGRAVRRVIVLGPSHFGDFRGLSIVRASHYETPFGKVPLDLEAIASLRRAPLVTSDTDAHRREHGIEIQLPFLQRVLAPGWRLVPVLVGRMGPDDYARAAQLLRPLADAETLIITSSDFTHYGPRFRYLPFPPDAGRIERLDGGLFNRIVTHDVAGFLRYREETGITVCGWRPLAILLELMPAEASVTRVDYALSGTLNHRNPNSVSYLSAIVSAPGAFSAANQAPAHTDRTADPQSLDDSQMALLHWFASRAVESAVMKRDTPPEELDAALANVPPALRHEAGAFVTLWVNGKLRGCVGYATPKGPLYEAVLRSAWAAATRDDRFAPLAPAEMNELEIEISVLSPPRGISTVADYDVDTHGIILSMDGRSALYLPRVAAEMGWDRNQTLSHLALKAGLAEDAWKDDNTRLQVFTNRRYSAPYIPPGGSSEDPAPRATATRSTCANHR
jgi:AmmeMemoRadiSam system protein B/AmmeMemoRadiSam system protein A